MNADGEGSNKPGQEQHQGAFHREFSKKRVGLEL
jgi:hypothetical protein